MLAALCVLTACCSRKSAPAPSPDAAGFLVLEDDLDGARRLAVERGRRLLVLFSSPNHPLSIQTRRVLGTEAFAGVGERFVVSVHPSPGILSSAADTALAWRTESARERFAFDAGRSIPLLVAVDPGAEPKSDPTRAWTLGRSVEPVELERLRSWLADHSR